MAHLTFKEFDKAEVSTRPFIAFTNMKVDIEKVFDTLDIAPCNVPVPKRGRKKIQNSGEQQCETLPNGSIVTMKYMHRIRGVELRPKKTNPDKPTGFFRNSMTLVVVFDKVLNIKLYTNGTLQVTGCKRKEHVKTAVRFIWDCLSAHPELFSYTSGTAPSALLIPSMRNMNFSLNFKVDREKLNVCMSERTVSHDLYSMLVTFLIHTGSVNIKFPLSEDVTQLPITTMKLRPQAYYKEASDKNESFEGESCTDYTAVDVDGTPSVWVEGSVPYSTYLDTLPPAKRKKKISKCRYNTFLVFQSGSVIMSGIQAEYMKPHYEKFISIIRECYEDIEERLDTGPLPENVLRFMKENT